MTNSVAEKRLAAHASTQRSGELPRKQETDNNTYTTSLWQGAGAAPTVPVPPVRLASAGAGPPTPAARLAADLATLRAMGFDASDQTLTSLLNLAYLLRRRRTAGTGTSTGRGGSGSGSESGSGGRGGRRRGRGGRSGRSVERGNQRQRRGRCGFGGRARRRRTRLGRERHHRFERRRYTPRSKKQANSNRGVNRGGWNGRRFLIIILVVKVAGRLRFGWSGVFSSYLCRSPEDSKSVTSKPENSSGCA
jgi:hypothetical protein